jgi:glycosyltransferase involved in cell wall biosynthesis
VVIPAFNAALTLAEAIDSVVAQSHTEWEVVVVDDGSTDATGEIARSYAERDSRIRVVSQPNGGESAARNTGIDQARYDWLLFLDSDDWIAPAHLERLTSVLLANPELDAVHCGSVRVTADGTQISDDYQPPEGDLFPVLARRAAFPVHACIVRACMVRLVGKLDTSLKKCPDWDLWQRIARAGARFGAVREVLAYYRIRPNSSSLEAEQLFRDDLTVLRRGHAPDPRVPNPLPEYANGLAGDAVESQAFYLLCWGAGLLLGSGKDARILLEQVRDLHYTELYPHAVAQCILEAGTLPSSQPREVWEQLFPPAERNVEEFLTALEAQSKTPGLAVAAMLELKRMILESSPLWHTVVEQQAHQVEEQQALVQQREREAEEQRQTVESLTRQIEEKQALLAQREREAEERSQSLARQIEEQQALVQQWERNANEQKRAVESLAQRVSWFEGQHERLLDTIQLREEKASLQQMLAELRRQELGVRQELSAIQHQEIALRHDLEEARQREFGLQVELKLARHQHSLFQQELEDSRRWHEAIQQEMQDARQQHALFQVELEDSRSQHSLFRQELADAREQHSFIQQELDRAHEREAAVRQEVEVAHQRELALRQEVEAAHQRETMLRREMESAGEWNSELEQALADARREQCALSDEVECMAEALDQTRASGEQMAEDRASLKDALHRSRDSAWNRWGRKLGLAGEISVAAPPAPAASSFVAGSFTEAPPEDWPWELLTGPRSEAKVRTAADDPETFRVAISRAVSQVPWDIQLNRAGLALHPKHRYLLRFKVRADRPRTVMIGVAKAAPPWSNLGFSTELLLKPEWQDFSAEFAVSEPESNARIHLDLGGRRIAVELSSFEVQDLTHP